MKYSLSLVLLLGLSLVQALSKASVLRRNQLAYDPESDFNDVLLFPRTPPSTHSDIDIKLGRLLHELSKRLQCPEVFLKFFDFPYFDLDNVIRVSELETKIKELEKKGASRSPSTEKLERQPLLSSEPTANLQNTHREPLQLVKVNQRAKPQSIRQKIKGCVGRHCRAAQKFCKAALKGVRKKPLSTIAGGIGGIGGVAGAAGAATGNPVVAGLGSGLGGLGSFAAMSAAMHEGAKQERPGSPPPRSPTGSPRNDPRRRRPDKQEV